MRKIIETNITGLFVVTHEAFETDHIGVTTTIIPAENAPAAADIYEEMQKQRTRYPYYWGRIFCIKPLTVPMFAI